MTAGLYRISPDSDVFWQNMKQERLVLPFCKCCERPHFPPLPGCPYCGSGVGFDHRQVKGDGRVYSWTVAHYAFWPEMKHEVPYTIVTVALEAGPRMYGRITGVSPDADLTNLSVRLTYHHGPQLTLPYFIPKQQAPVA